MTIGSTSTSSELAVMHNRGMSLVPLRSNRVSYVRWKPRQISRPSLAEIEDEFARFDPAMIANVTGLVSRRLTFDFDGEIGRELYKHLQLPAPHRTTPSGGFHLDVEWPDDDLIIPSLTYKGTTWLGELHPGLDLRGQGGLAIVWGADQRGEYEWIRPYEPVPFSVIEDLMPDLVEALRDRQKGPGRGTASKGRRRASRPVSEGATGSLASRFAQHLSAESSRNEAVFQFALACRDRGVLRETVDALVPEIVDLANREYSNKKDHPYEAEEAHASIASAYQYGDERIVRHVARVHEAAGQAKWGRDSQRRVLSTICRKLLEINREYVVYSLGDIALEAGVCERTAKTATKKLRDSGWLVGSRPSNWRHATIWTIWPQYPAGITALEPNPQETGTETGISCTTQQQEEEQDSLSPLSRGASSARFARFGRHAAHDGARHGALGSARLAILELLEADPDRRWTVKEVTIALHRDASTIRKHLKAMSPDALEHPFVVREGNRLWRLATTDLDVDAALQAHAVERGTYGKGAIQRQRQEDERLANMIAAESPELLEPLLSNPFVQDEHLRRQLGHQLGWERDRQRRTTSRSQLEDPPPAPRPMSQHTRRTRR